MFAIQGNILASLALLGYIPFALALFAMLPSRKAAIWTVLIAWLFLPMSNLPIPGFTSLNKMSLACVGTLLGTCLFDPDTLLSFRFKIWDIPMLIFCLCPFLSAKANGYSTYDGLAGIAYHTIDWGLPYLIGRIYFTDLAAMRELAVGIVIGGLLYVPLCWYEVRMSPQLHRIVYGFTQFDFSQTKRYGSYRPMVFMQTGLAVSMWMTSAALAACWLWYTKTRQRIMGMNTGWVAAILLFTCIGTRSFGAIALLGIGLLVLYATKVTKRPALVLILALVPPFWITTRTLNVWTGSDLEDLVRQVAVGRADSLHTRLVNERKLVDRALLQPAFGWTGYKYNIDKTGKRQLGIPDMMWVIVFGQCGLVGLISMTVAMLLPIPLLAWKIPARYWHLASAAPAAALMMLGTLHMCDMLFNAMVNPVFLMGVGGICGMTFSLRNPAIETQKQPSIYAKQFSTPAPGLRGPEMGGLPTGRRPASV